MDEMTVKFWTDKSSQLLDGQVAHCENWDKQSLDDTKILKLEQ